MPALLHYLIISNAISIVSEQRVSLEEAAVLTTEVGQVGRDGLVLVARPRKVVRKPSTGQVGSDLGVHTRRAADSRDEGACRPHQVSSVYFQVKENNIHRMRGNTG
jgi:hypothetical protein